jgi:succinyl-CoA synthetase alpha subunit
MSILIDSNTRVLTQGITGKEGLFHSIKCREYGTHVVGGVTPGKGGLTVEGFPVFHTVEECVRKTGADTSMVFVPAPFAADAVLEAVDAGIRLIVVITEGIPVMDMLKVRERMTESGCLLIGPNSPGIVTSGEARVGIAPVESLSTGKIGIVSRSGTLTYEAICQTTRLGLGQTTMVGTGGDPVHGLSLREVCALFNEDSETEGILLIGEIGGQEEEKAAEFIKNEMKKPVAAFIAGRTAPVGRRMGHAGAIIERSTGTARSKTEALEKAGVVVAVTAGEMGKAMVKAMDLLKS